MMKSETENCGITRPRPGTSSCHHQTGRINVNDDMPHSHNKTLMKFTLVGLRHDRHG